jgi:2'-5' RNA ligase
LGETTENQVNEINDTLQYEFLNIKGFSVFTGPLGYFKGRECLRVVYLGIKDSEGKLVKVFNKVEQCCRSVGFKEEERRYTPHVTIAQDVALSTGFDSIKSYTQDLSSFKIPVEKISIIKSDQVDDKRLYTAIKSIKLR